MMDSFRPLKVAKAARTIEDESYQRSWIEAQHGLIAPEQGMHSA
jgi:homogentisate 1,2-dioxygenase